MSYNVFGGMLKLLNPSVCDIHITERCSIPNIFLYSS